ncbi:hypothetical protein LTR37_015775 [Vermiconidia calcicola]|uniref:Uncharacterized protein n=1 Tax=Vermiconidia calcicola TaxID=1690605 RepID=A0ACC3MRF6_9PEZI|nr:hypothetical protein LTR37_015775 [Vermiconidia calcicola]
MDNSYITVINANNFAEPDLSVLKNMVIFRHEDDSNGAHFEDGAAFSVEGTATQVDFTPGVSAGYFAFKHPNTDADVIGQWLFADPTSDDGMAKKVLKEVEAARSVAGDQVVPVEMVAEAMKNAGYE